MTIENVPSFLKKERRKKPGQSVVDTSLNVEAAGLFLETAYLKAELVATSETARESAQRAEQLQSTLVEFVDYNRFLLRAVEGYRGEVSDAYDQLGEVPQLLDKARYSGYLARVKEVALARIEARKRERENRFSTRVVNLIRGRVTSLMTTVPQIVSSVGSRIRNII